MKYRLPFSIESGNCRFLVVAAITTVVLTAACKQRSTQEKNSGDKPPTELSGETTAEMTELKLKNLGNENPITKADESENIKSQTEINELIQLAAGPMAESVNSGLSHLDGHLATKEHTLRIMALNSETRRWYFLSRTVALIDDEQLRQASALIESHDIIYKDLLDRRARILETEHDGDRVRQLLKYNKVAAIMVGVQIRQRLLREVLSPEQRKRYHAQFEQPAESKAPPDNPTEPPATENNQNK